MPFVSAYNVYNAWVVNPPNRATKIIRGSFFFLFRFHISMDIDEWVNLTGMRVQKTALRRQHLAYQWKMVYCDQRTKHRKSLWDGFYVPQRPCVASLSQITHLVTYCLCIQLVELASVRFITFRLRVRITSLFVFFHWSSNIYAFDVPSLYKTARPRWIISKFSHVL